MLMSADNHNSTGKEAVYGAGGLPASVLVAAQALAAIALVVTLVITYFYIQKPTDPMWQRAFQAAWIFWIFAPPIWLSYEYFYLFKPYGRVGTFEAFKYGQELAYRAWVGIAAAMTLLYVQKP